MTDIPFEPEPAAEPAIVADGLTKVYETRRKGTVTAVDSLTFRVERGQVVGLLGGNGAGKTTTISMMLGLLLPSDGQVRVLGTDMARNRAAALPRMNFSSPYVDLPHRLTVRENLMVYAHLYALTRPRDRILALAEDLAFTDLLKRPAGKLSAGQKTRVALAKALLNDPAVLLLDEPTASLDPDTGDWVRGYLESWRARTGATLFLASHNMAEVERLCDTVLVMRGGRIQERGAPRALIDRFGRSTLEEVFLDIARNRQRPPDATAPAESEEISP